MTTSTVRPKLATLLGPRNWHGESQNLLSVRYSVTSVTKIKLKLKTLFMYMVLVSCTEITNVVAKTAEIGKRLITLNDMGLSYNG